MSILFFIVLLLTVSCESFAWTSKHSKREQHRVTTISPTNRFASTDIVDYEASTEDELISLGQDRLAKYFDFPLDDWQLQAGGLICSGYNVIVCAPTGAGKTVVGEMALLHAFHVSNQCGIYTTPLKALSNQKYSDLCRMFGSDNTGLSTGDISINKDAQIRVMTTEVYRNIAWRSSTPSATIMGSDELSKNAVVVLDEFHYMGYPGRGGVWEESVITSPNHTQIVGLSATLANGQALTSWMESVSGRKTVLVEVPGQKRPVPLRYLFATKKGLFPLFRDPDAGPGAPKGLLGYRGDGEPPKGGKAVNNKKSGFATEGAVGKERFPRGLQINPALKAVAKDRLEKVMRTLQRRKRKDVERDSGDDFAFNSKRRLSPREERREKDRLLRNEMRRSVPSLPMLLTRLKQKDLLPAIFFIFSRVGCDEAARNAYQTMSGPSYPDLLLDSELEQFANAENQPTKRKNLKGRQRARKKAALAEDSNGRIFRPENNFVSEEVLSSYLDDSDVEVENNKFDESSPLAPENWEYCSKAGLLNYNEVREVASRISVFNDQNPEIAFDDEISEQFLFGIGSHHAGMLPAHKSFVEILFRRQLMKVVFATETLAAGINMPARTTAVCAMAKRGGAGGSSMSLLETSNLLQMAGRAGRRGFDTEGTCVIVATAFESEEDAVKILTDPVKPIESQFTPSYSLAVNLIARGEGRLEVARQLVSKSFAAWGKRQAEERLYSAVEGGGGGVSEVLQASAQEQFMTLLVEYIQAQVNRRKKKSNEETAGFLVELMTDREALKKTSKSYIAVSKALELEEITLSYLNMEAQDMEQKTAVSGGEEVYEALLQEESMDLVNQISKQRVRVLEAEKAVHKHPFTTITNICNELVSEGSPEATVLESALANARTSVSGNENSAVNSPLEARELTEFAKSTVAGKRRKRKLANANPGLDMDSLDSLHVQAENMDDGSWEDMLAITKSLLAYNCIVENEGINLVDDASYEVGNYSLTPAGMNVGMLGFENSLWALIAIGGTWCVNDAVSDFYSIQNEIESWDNESTLSNDLLQKSKAEEEAEKLVSLLCQMSPAEVAGYISAIVSENSRGPGGNDVLDVFRNLTPTQQRIIQTSLLSMDQFLEVQQHYSVDPGTRNCNFEISYVEVVTAWAGGCTWNEALQLSGLPPGDLVRILSRVLDAVRQLGNLPYEAIRKDDLTERGIRLAPGIHPEVRHLCREAAKAINRFPVKDPLAFETPVEPDDDDEEEDDDDDDETLTGTSQVDDITS